MLQPKRTKHRKAQKGRIRQVAKRGTTIAFGSFALKALEPIWMTNRQIEAARQALTRSMKREGNVWIRIFPDKPVTRKPQEVRMGKGKGNPEFWAAGRAQFDNYVSPWLDLVDDARFQRTVDRIAALQPTVIAGCHTAPVTGPNVAEAIAQTRRSPGAEYAPQPDQAVLDQIQATLGAILPAA